MAGTLTSGLQHISYPYLLGTEQLPIDTEYTGGASPQSAYATAGDLKAFERASVAVAAPTITPDLSVSSLFNGTLTGATTLANPLNTVPGQSFRLVLTQDATGSRVLSYGSNYVGTAGSKPTLTTTANATDVLTCIVLTNGKILVTANLAVA